MTQRKLLAAACAAVIVPIAIGQAPNSFSGIQTSASKVFDVATVKLRYARNQSASRSAGPWQCFDRES